jgi:hypothetical protein
MPILAWNFLFLNGSETTFIEATHIFFTEAIALKTCTWKRYFIECSYVIHSIEDIVGRAVSQTHNSKHRSRKTIIS